MNILVNDIIGQYNYTKILMGDNHGIVGRDDTEENNQGKLAQKIDEVTVVVLSNVFPGATRLLVLFSLRFI